MKGWLLTWMSVWLLAGPGRTAEIRMEPFAIDWRDNAGALVDLSHLLDAPAGKDGPIRIKNGHLAKPNGDRFRIWGVNVTGATCFPSKTNAPIVADHLARFGINAVRFHFLDSNWSASLFVKDRDDTRALDPDQLDKLDAFVAELKKRGIYTNLNLNVGRNYRAGDGVKDHEYLGLAKVVNYFDERVQMLHREYARQLLTHRNPYTQTEYRHEPAVAVVELVNENSIVEAWFSDRLLGKNTSKRPGTWSDITAGYANALTERYNQWLAETRTAAQIQQLRQLAGVAEGQPVPRLTRKEFAQAPALRFHTEAAFYMDLERTYFSDMTAYLKRDLGVTSLVVGTSDHNHWNSGYPLLTSTSQCDIVDGHVYWQHPNYITDPDTGQQGFRIDNTPMVDDPLHSTVVELSRSAIAGKPYTVSETNHPFPNEYAAEGIPILAAYAALQDWDGIFLYTFEHKAPADWGQAIPRHFEIQPDPVKMAHVAGGACLFLRGDLRPAVRTISRSYSPEQVRESIRMPSSQRPYFTPGFDLGIPLVHGSRISGFDRLGGPPSNAGLSSPFVADTAELTWSYGAPRAGLVTIETDRSQGLIGFAQRSGTPLRNLMAEVANEFCSITLTSLDDQPISAASRLLLIATARSANTGMKWNGDRTSLTDWGAAPTVIEPVRATITLRDLVPARTCSIVALDGAAKPLPAAIDVENTDTGCRFAIGDPATTWYLIRFER